MDCAANAKFQRVSHRKVSRLLNEIRGKNVTLAEHIIHYAGKRVSTIIGMSILVDRWR